jgi:tetratricopeptide (TPR) repeat protein
MSLRSTALIVGLLWVGCSGGGTGNGSSGSASSGSGAGGKAGPVVDSGPAGPKPEVLLAEMHLRVGTIHLRAKRYQDASRSFDSAIATGAPRWVPLATFAAALARYRGGDHAGAKKGFDAYREGCSSAPAQTRRQHCDLLAEASAYRARAQEALESKPKSGPEPDVSWLLRRASWRLPSSRVLALNGKGLERLREYYGVRAKLRDALSALLAAARKQDKAAMAEARARVDRHTRQAETAAGALRRALPASPANADQAILIHHLELRVMRGPGYKSPTSPARVRARALAAVNAGLERGPSALRRYRLLYLRGVLAEIGADNEQALAAYSKAIGLYQKMTAAR